MEANSGSAACEPGSELCPSAKLLSLTVNGSSDAALLVDVDGKVLHANASARSLFGTSEEHLFSYWTLKDDTKWGDAISLIGSEPIIKEASLAIENGKEVPGTVKLTKLAGCPCCDNVYIAAYVSPASAAETDSWLTAQHMQDVVDGSFDPMFSVDEVGKILMVNEAAVDLFGWTREELLGQNVAMICGGPHGDMHIKYMLRYKETGITKVMGKKRELPAKRKDGSEFPIELGLREVRNNSDHFFCAFIRDLSAQKQFEKEIKHRAEIAQAAFDSSFDPMFEIDQRGIISMVNAAALALFGWDKEEFLGSNISMICGGEHAGHHDEYIAKYLETGVKHIIGRKRAVLARRKDGSEFHIELGVQEAWCSNGERVFCGYVKDLTERKLQQRRIRKQQDVIHDKFFGGDSEDN